MTEDDAIELAWSFINQGNYTITGLKSVTKFRAETLPPRLRDEGDVWMVRFGVPIPPNQKWSSDTINVRVYDATAKVDLLRWIKQHLFCKLLSRCQSVSMLR